MQPTGSTADTHGERTESAFVAPVDLVMRMHKRSPRSLGDIQGIA
jgi:hypothetical protein